MQTHNEQTQASKVDQATISFKDFLKEWGALAWENDELIHATLEDDDRKVLNGGWVLPTYTNYHGVLFNLYQEYGEDPRDFSRFMKQLLGLSVPYNGHDLELIDRVVLIARANLGHSVNIGTGPQETLLRLVIEQLPVVKQLNQQGQSRYPVTGDLISQTLASIDGGGKIQHPERWWRAVIDIHFLAKKYSII